MKIALGSDHAGFVYKEAIKRMLVDTGHDVVDYGTDSTENCDYPLFIRPAAEAVARGEADRAIVLGGSGNGEAIVANKVRGIRCALVWDEKTAERGPATQRRQLHQHRRTHRDQGRRTCDGENLSRHPVRRRPPRTTRQADRGLSGRARRRSRSPMSDGAADTTLRVRYCAAAARGAYSLTTFGQVCSNCRTSSSKAIASARRRASSAASSLVQKFAAWCCRSVVSRAA